MASKKISQLTALSTADAADLIIIGDVSATETKKITVGQLLGGVDLSPYYTSVQVDDLLDDKADESAVQSLADAVSGRLRISSNLGDLDNPDEARANLELSDLAITDPGDVMSRSNPDSFGQYVAYDSGGDSSIVLAPDNIAAGGTAPVLTCQNADDAILLFVFDASGNATFEGNVISNNGRFVGSGSGLTGILDSALTSNVPLKNASSNVFTGTLSVASGKHTVAADGKTVISHSGTSGDALTITTAEGSTSPFSFYRASDNLQLFTVGFPGSGGVDLNAFAGNLRLYSAGLTTLRTKVRIGGDNANADVLLTIRGTTSQSGNAIEIIQGSTGTRTLYMTDSGAVTASDTITAAINRTTNLSSGNFTNSSATHGTNLTVGQDTANANIQFGYYGSGQSSFQALLPSTAYMACGTSAAALAINTSSSTQPIIFCTNNWVKRGSVDGNGNWVLGTAAIATTATNGFTYIPSCAGTPTGTPTAYTGLTPMVYDTSANKLWINNGSGWKSVALT